MSTNKYFKQINYIDELLRKRKWEAVVKRDFRTLAKYYRHKEFKTKATLYKKLVETCSKKGSAWFNEVSDFPLLDRCVNEALKVDNTIVQIESIDVSDNEWNAINDETLNLNQKERKILFGMLIHAKLKNERSAQNNSSKSDKLYFGGNGKFNYKQLLDSLNDKYTRTFLDKDVHLIVKKFNELGLAKTYYNTSVELLFVESEKDSNVKIIIYDFDSIGLYWEYEFGNPKVKKCEICYKNLIKMTTGNITKCNICQNEENKKSWRDSKRKSRMSKS